ncbi:GNAT family N-acetyltransferase [Nonomuraea sp. NPDC049152]|uniref:GNAT family N-acetyltransferase n=1 Tax=Nonomuraea sp. NPDC049152 TaxID=3154350 RepID=UPI0033DB3A8E
MMLAELLSSVAAGKLPDADGTVTIVPQPSPRDMGVIAFTGHSVVFADLDHGWLRDRLPEGDLSAPLNPPFLRALELETGRTVDNVDALVLAQPLDGSPPAGLAEVTGDDRPRVARAMSHRDAVRVWACEEGVLTIGRGVAGRWEVSVEVDPEHRGRGVGRRLASAARGLCDEPLWAQIAPGNAASLRAFLAAGFAPVGAEALLVADETR